MFWRSVDSVVSLTGSDSRHSLAQHSSSKCVSRRRYLPSPLEQTVTCGSSSTARVSGGPLRGRGRRRRLQASPSCDSNPDPTVIGDLPGFKKLAQQTLAGSSSSARMQQTAKVCQVSGSVLDEMRLRLCFSGFPSEAQLGWSEASEQHIRICCRTEGF